MPVTEQKRRNDSTWVTQCPECKTAFRVTLQQLKVARGSVRCGNCLCAFKAMPHLVSPKKPPQELKPNANSAKNPAPNKAPARKPAQATDPIYQPAARQTAPQNPLAPEHSRPTATQPAKEKAQTRAQASTQTPAQARAQTSAQKPAQARAQASAQKPAQAQAQAHAQASTQTPAQTRAQASTQKPAQTRAQVSAQKLVQARAQTSPQKPAQAQAQASPQKPAQAQAQASAQTPAQAQAKTSAQTPAQTKVQTSAQPKLAKKAPPKPQTKNKKGQLTKAQLTKGQLKAKSFAIKKRLSLKLTSKALLIGGAIASFGLFAFQHVYFNHHIEDSVARKTALLTCHLVGCEIPPLSDLEKILINSVVVRNDPEYTNGLTIDAIITNTANFSQRYPSLLMVIHSAEGDIIGTRQLTPDQYLAGEATGETNMPPRKPVHLSLKILKPQTDAHRISFEFIN